MSIVVEDRPLPQVAGPVDEVGGDGQRSRPAGARRVDVPVTAEAAERMGRLARLHHRRVVHYLFVRVEDRALAEDLAQDMWLDLAMRPYEMDGWADREDADLFPLLAWRAKRMIHQHLRVLMNERERVLGVAREGDDRSVDERMDALMGPGPEDETECAVLELLGEDDAPAFSACYAQALSVLSKRQRQVIELRCEGMTTRAIADRMGDSHGNVGIHLRAALKVLRDPQEIARRLERQDRDRLPDGWEKTLERLPASQAEVVRLRTQGVSASEIARRTGRHVSSVANLYQRALVNLRKWAQDRAADPRTQADARGASGRSCGDCTATCLLRAGQPTGTASKAVAA